MLSAFSRMQHVLSTTTSASAEVAGGDQPVGLEQAGDALGVVLVHLAPERAHDVATRIESVRSPTAGQATGGRRRLASAHDGSGGRQRATARAHPRRSPGRRSSGSPLAATGGPVPMATEDGGGLVDAASPCRPPATSSDRTRRGRSCCDEPPESTLAEVASRAPPGRRHHRHRRRRLLHRARVDRARLDRVAARRGSAPSRRPCWLRRRGPPRELTDAVDDGLGALAAGPVDDVIIACWVRLEEAAAAGGVSRQPSETSAELVVRVLARFDVPDEPVQRLLVALPRRPLLPAPPRRGRPRGGDRRARRDRRGDGGDGVSDELEREYGVAQVPAVAFGDGSVLAIVRPICARVPVRAALAAPCSCSSSSPSPGGRLASSTCWRWQRLPP